MYPPMIFACRKILQRSGKDHTILLVLPMGIYHYKFIVDGEVRYIPDLPCVADETGVVFNLLDVNVSEYSASCLVGWEADLPLARIANCIITAVAS